MLILNLEKGTLHLSFYFLRHFNLMRPKHVKLIFSFTVKQQLMSIIFLLDMTTIHLHFIILMMRFFFRSLWQVE